MCVPRVPRGAVCCPLPSLRVPHGEGTVCPAGSRLVSPAASAGMVSCSWWVRAAAGGCPQIFTHTPQPPLDPLPPRMARTGVSCPPPALPREAVRAQ